jgi:phosphate transport system protein
MVLMVRIQLAPTPTSAAWQRPVGEKFTRRSPVSDSVASPVTKVKNVRNQYQQQLSQVLTELVEMTGDVRAGLSRATRALLDADAAAAESVISGDLEIDAARERIEEESFEILARQQPVAGDLRMLVASLRMVTDLERMGDLAVHVAKVARLRYPTQAVPPVLVPTIEAMARTADEMIASAAEIVATSDVRAAAELESADDDMDDLRRSMFRILLGDEWDAGVEPAVDLALLGRYYERIGDHAVSMARRIVFLVTGQHPAAV